MVKLGGNVFLVCCWLGQWAFVGLSPVDKGPLLVRRRQELDSSTSNPEIRGTSPTRGLASITLSTAWNWIAFKARQG